MSNRATVLALLATGLRPAAIAREMQITPSLVAYHLRCLVRTWHIAPHGERSQRTYTILRKTLTTKVKPAPPPAEVVPDATPVLNLLLASRVGLTANAVATRLGHATCWAQRRLNVLVQSGRVRTYTAIGRVHYRAIPLPAEPDGSPLSLPRAAVRPAAAAPSPRSSHG